MARLIGRHGQRNEARRATVFGVRYSIPGRHNSATKSRLMSWVILASGRSRHLLRHPKRCTGEPPRVRANSSLRDAGAGEVGRIMPALSTPDRLVTRISRDPMRRCAFASLIATHDAPVVRHRCARLDGTSFRGKHADIAPGAVVPLRRPAPMCASRRSPVRCSASGPKASDPAAILPIIAPGRGRLHDPLGDHIPGRKSR